MTSLKTTFPAQTMTVTAASACRQRLAQDSIGAVVFDLAPRNVLALAERCVR